MQATTIFGRMIDREQQKIQHFKKNANASWFGQILATKRSHS
jgi:hypothetical protein